LIWSPETNLYPIAQKEFSEITYLHHKELYEVILKKDPEEVSQAIKVHILRRITDFNNHLRQPENSDFLLLQEN
jgi:DNA-binding FadR family transcriptional regulator